MQAMQQGELNRIRRDLSLRNDVDDDWVTIKHTHVLLNEEGVAMSGGKLKGMTFKHAKSVKGKHHGAGAKGKQEPKEAQKPKQEKISAELSQCTSTKEVHEYLRKKGYFKKGQLNIKGMPLKTAVSVAERIESLHQEYPFLNGNVNGFRVKYLGESTYGKASKITGEIELNNKYFCGKDNSQLQKAYGKDVMFGFHPKGTTAESIVDHEYTHVIESMLNKEMKKKGESLSAADYVMYKTAERYFKVPDNKYVSLAQMATIRAKISGYAANNKGVDFAGHEKDPGYGINTEFLAEAMAYARCSTEPNDVALIAQEELNKLIKEYL